MAHSKVMIRRFVVLSAVVVMGLCGCEVADPVVFHWNQGNDDDDVIQTGMVVISDEAENWGVDDYVVNAGRIVDDTLQLSLSYGGGCRDHVFTLVASSTFEDTSPLQLRAVLAHNADNDPCQAYFTFQYSFDLNPIKVLYQTTYGQESGVVVLHLEGVENDRLVYEF